MIVRIPRCCENLQQSIAGVGISMGWKVHENRVSNPIEERWMVFLVRGDQRVLARAPTVDADDLNRECKKDPKHHGTD